MSEDEGRDLPKMTTEVDHTALMLFMGAALVMVEVAESHGARRSGKATRELAVKLLDSIGPLKTASRTTG